MLRHLPALLAAALHRLPRRLLLARQPGSGGTSSAGFALVCEARANRSTRHPFLHTTSGTTERHPPGVSVSPLSAPGQQVLRCLGAVYSITTFIRAITSLLQIRQVAHLRSATCSLQGLSSTQRSARATPSRDRTLGVMHLPWLELECTNPGSPRGQPGAREQEN